MTTRHGARDAAAAVAVRSRASRLHVALRGRESGFTLIELLVVVVIIGILIAIAIPLYLNYRKGANDKGAQSDLRAAISTLENCQADSNGYPVQATAISYANGTAPCTGQKLALSGGTSMKYIGSASGYIIQAFNTNGNTSASNWYCYASAAGGSVTRNTGTFPTTYAATFTC